MTDTPTDVQPDDSVPSIDRVIPEDTTLARLAGQFATVTFEERAAGAVAHVRASDLAEFAAAARNAGYDYFIDLCGVDYLRRRPRFEVVVNLLSPGERRRLRIRTGVDGTDATVPSITAVFPGANFYEREAYDLFGITFDGHPDLTRILLPDDWEGFPLRKDYSVGSVPVQFKGSHKAS